MASANYLVTPKNGTLAQLSAANVNRDGTGTLVTVFTTSATALGSRIDRIALQATGNTTAGMVRLFLTNAAGTTTRLFDEIPVWAATPSGTQPAFAVDIVFDNGLVLENGASLRASTHNAEVFNLIPVVAGDFA